ncbi:hypothetical protein A8C56_21490 [Niabella ginsenosidivorans]|uniref:Uncharacterized protein n=1 Tax=Niabella ginsenosidivorans TaxID=1176587 RepID=A0A1A9I6A6_9BACT|nr:hypothetical protein A8C56_21490 [Niabella ginsenosidivorans]
MNCFLLMNSRVKRFWACLYFLNLTIKGALYERPTGMLGFQAAAQYPAFLGLPVEGSSCL